MQTFLPYPDFRESARVLDMRRLGKQRVEAKQIATALVRGGAWSRHPATLMWSGHLVALGAYYNAVLDEWVRRGYRSTMVRMPTSAVYRLPFWVGDDTFHASHRSNLLRKDPAHYGQFGWQEPSDLPYVWPVPVHSLVGIHVAEAQA